MAKTYLDKPREVEKDNADKLQILKTRLSVARKIDKENRDKLKNIVKVLDFKREVSDGSTTATTKVKYPLAWAAYENYLAELGSTPPQTIIDAEGKEDNVKKIFWKGVLQYIKRRLRLDDKKMKFIDSFVQSGKGIYKVGRVVETVKGKKVAEYELEGKTDKLETEIEAITKNETYVQVIDPRRFYLSPETEYEGPMLSDNCPYCIEEMVKTPKYLEDRYGITVEEDEKELIDPEADLDKQEDDTGKTPSHMPGENVDDMKRVRLYAYYGLWEIDGKEEANAEVLFTNKRIIKARVLPYQHGKKPYIVAIDFKKFFKPIAKSSMETVLDLDQEYNEHMNRIRTILRRMASPKYAKLTGSNVDETALLDPDVGVVVDESQPNAFRVIDTGKADPTLFEKATSVEQLFYLLTGIVYGSSALNKSGTATGQSMVKEGSDGKMARKITILERAQEELETMILQLEQQYASQEGTDIRVVGADVVEMIRNKKKLFAAAQELYQFDMQAIEMNAPEQGIDPTQIDPSSMPQSPVDEYANFQISEDGRAVLTSYTREDIQGEFELNIVSQSSNRSDRNIKAQQMIQAIELSGADPMVKRDELWKRLFSLWGFDDVENLVNSGMQQPMLQAQAGMPQAAPNQASMQAGMQQKANAVV